MKKRMEVNFFIMLFFMISQFMLCQSEADKKLESLINEQLQYNFSIKHFLRKDKFINPIEEFYFSSKSYYLKTSIKKLNSIQIPKFIIYEVDVEQKLYTKNGSILVFNGKGRELYGEGKKVLIAVKEKDNLIFEIRFLSGRLFHSKYASLLLNKWSTKDDFVNFLRIKLFSESIENIKYESKNRKWIYFSGYKVIFENKTKVYYRMNKNNYDLVEYLGWKKSGKYKLKEKIQIF